MPDNGDTPELTDTIRIRPENILVRGDGDVLIEGDETQVVVNALIRDQANILGFFRRFAPDLDASHISVDALGRVRIHHPKITQIARALIEHGSDASKVGTAVAVDPNVQPADTQFGCGSSAGSALDVLCADRREDDPLSDGNMDVICGRTNLDGTEPGPCNFDNINFICGFDSH